MYCQKCGNQIKETAAYCPKCGWKNDEIPEIVSKRTPSVKEERKSDDISEGEYGKKSKSSKNMCIIGLIISIFSFLFSFISLSAVKIPGVLFAIIALVLSFLGTHKMRMRNKIAIVTMVISCLSIVLCFKIPHTYTLADIERERDETVKDWNIVYEDILNALPQCSDNYAVDDLGRVQIMPDGSIVADEEIMKYLTVKSIEIKSSALADDDVIFEIKNDHGKYVITSPNGYLKSFVINSRNSK